MTLPLQPVRAETPLASSGESTRCRFGDRGSRSRREKVNGRAVFDGGLGEERTGLAVQTAEGHAAVFGADADGGAVLS